MRVTFNSVFSEGSDNIRSAADRMSQAQRQVSSGNRLNALSDDPSAAMSAVSEHASLAGLDAYSRTADVASSRLAITDSVLSDIVDKISAARTVVIGAQGSVATPSQRTAAANELQSLRDAVLGDLNTSFSGTYLFAGSGATAPYVIAGGTVGSYQGNATPVQVDVEAGRSVSITKDGGAIAKGSDAQDVFTVLSDLVTAAQNGDSAVLAWGSPRSDARSIARSWRKRRSAPTCAPSTTSRSGMTKRAAPRGCG